MHSNAADTVRQLYELFHYNAYCNQQVIGIIAANQKKTSQKAVLLLNHTLNAHHIWNARINGVANKFGVWEIHTSEQLQAIDEENTIITENILSGKHIASSVTYQNMKGETFSNTIADILFHIINHSTYHRGQIQTEFKSSGIAPISLDYIFYKRMSL